MERRDFLRSRYSEESGSKCIPHSSHCVQKIHGYTDSLTNSGRQPRSERDGIDHIHTNCRPEGLKSLAAWQCEGMRDLLLPAMCQVHCLLKLQALLLARINGDCGLNLGWLFRLQPKNNQNTLLVFSLPSPTQLYSNKVEW